MDNNAPSNTAAWLYAKQVPFTVGPSPYTPPKADEIVVKNHAVAINPIDWIKQVAGDFLFSYIKYPFVLGSDSAGEVAEVGSAVTRFKVGDRVLGHAVGTDPKRNSAAEGSFQTYTVLLATMASPIPADMTYERAAVLPLGLSTAACGLFEKDQLALEYPTVPPRRSGTARKTLLVWGGSTSVGSNAIQLAVAAGYEVITTASPKNFDYVKKLGASQVFDYHDEDVVPKIIGALSGKNMAGALAIGAGSPEACVDIVRACQGNKFVSMATFPVSFDQPLGEKVRVPSIVLRFLWFSVALFLTTRTRGVRTKFIFGSSLIRSDVGRAVYVDFLPKALAERQFVAAPEPKVVGSGLESIQAALDIQRKGVSAQKGGYRPAREASGVTPEVERLLLWVGLGHGFLGLVCLALLPVRRPSSLRSHFRASSQKAACLRSSRLAWRRMQSGPALTRWIPAPTVWAAQVRTTNCIGPRGSWTKRLLFAGSGWDNKLTALPVRPPVLS